MARAQRLATLIQRTVTGPMWHGPALAQVLESVTHEQAAQRPVRSAHTIWEIVLHVAAWAEIARARLHGQRTGDPTTAEDWPLVGAASLDDWRVAVERLGLSHRLLADEARDLTDDALDAHVRGADYSVDVLLHGVIEHGTYHGGQIMMLRKALE